MEKIDFNSKFFPESIKNIKNPPKCLYAEGNLDLLRTDSIAIIGSRACSINGMKVAKEFAMDLSRQGLTIISGMAIGIDTFAHIGALETNGRTIAVLGCGFNNIFPRENIKLYNEISSNNGLIISEYPPNEMADSKKFLERNRIVSGLASGVLVIEASYRSGTSVTCKFAKEQNKKIFCIPHEIDNKHGIGTNNLIKNGALLVTSYTDIINNIESSKFNKSLNSNLKKSKKSSENALSTDIKINPKYLDIYNFLMGPPVTIDQICNKLNKSLNEVIETIFMLELDGLIIKTPYGYQVNT